MAAPKISSSARNPPEVTEPRRLVQTCCGLTFLTILGLAPFAGKAIHMDDPIFLRVAEQIQAEPGDFFGFEMNWHGIMMPVADFNRNPPGLSYYLAAVMSLAGKSEVALHLAMIPAAVGVVLGTYLLARRYCARPLIPALCVLASPVFLISATTIMCETAMTCFWVWAVLFWVRGHEEGRWSLILGAALLMSLGILTKFQAVCLIPLLLVFSLADRRQLRFALALVIPIAALVGYELLTQARYGTSHFFDAAAFAMVFEGAEGVPIWGHLCSVLAFTGGALLPVLFCLPWALSLRAMAYLGGLAVIVVSACVFLLTPTPGVFETNDGIVWSLVLQYLLLAFSGCVVIWFALQDFLSDRGRHSGLLVLWVLGVIVFTAFVNWTVNGRTLLPLVPAAAILLSRRMESRTEETGTRRETWQIVTLMPALLVALLLTAADYQKARIAQTAANEISEWCRDQNSGRMVWFQGHWGFQWYMESHGATVLDFANPAWEDGDILVTPTDNTNVFLTHPARVLRTQTFAYEVPQYAATMCLERAAGFYSNIWGPLPFSFGAGMPESYHVEVIVPPNEEP